MAWTLWGALTLTCWASSCSPGQHSRLSLACGTLSAHPSLTGPLKPESAFEAVLSCCCRVPHLTPSLVMHDVSWHSGWTVGLTSSVRWAAVPLLVLRGFVSIPAGAEGHRAENLGTLPTKQPRQSLRPTEPQLHRVHDRNDTAAPRVWGLHTRLGETTSANTARPVRV